MDAQIQVAFDAAQQIVFLTGAGVSTASGIPDFRSANGLYTKNRNAEYYLSHRYFASDPAGFYQFCKDNLYFPAAQPNVIHQKQAALAPAINWSMSAPEAAIGKSPTAVKTE